VPLEPGQTQNHGRIRPEICDKEEAQLFMIAYRNRGNKKLVNDALGLFAIAQE
jgi:hypothetical protein